MDRHGIAQRIRELIHGQDDGNLATIAFQLRVDETSLRTSIDDLAPYPTVEVLAAILQHYAVDPGWLLTGDYNSSTHSLALASDALTSADSARRLIDSLSPEPVPRTTPPGISFSASELEQ